MHIISPLAAGVTGAANGTAEIYQRGSSARATYYTDFEGTAAVSSGADVALGANGQAVVYVNELVRVLVKDSGGVTVRDFVAGVSAPSVEVRSLSFTGVDYVSGASAPGNPTTLQTVLDLFLASFGDTDLTINNVLLSAATAQIMQGSFFNVKASPYNAVGDGVADDTAAIASAITAAATFTSSGASGGIVFFPPGTYATTDTIQVTNTVSLLGCGSNVSIIAPSHATNNAISLSGAAGTRRWRTVSGLAILPSAAHAGILVSINMAQDHTLYMHDCHLGNSSADGDCLTASAAGATSEIVIHRCYFTEGSVNLRSSRATVRDCRFVSAAGRFSRLLALNLNIDNCYFDGSAFSGTGITTETTETYITVPSAAAQTYRVSNCTFVAPAANNLVAICMSSVGQPVNAATDVYEVGNSFGTGVFAYYVRYTSASKGAKIWLGSRIGKRKEITGIADGGTYTISSNDAIDYETLTLKRTAGSSDQTIAFGTGNTDIVPDGNRSTVILWNETGGNITAQTFSVAGAGAAVTINNNLSAMVHAVWMQLESACGPYCVGIVVATGDPA